MASTINSWWDEWRNKRELFPLTYYTNLVREALQAPVADEQFRTWLDHIAEVNKVFSLQSLQNQIIRIVCAYNCRNPQVETDIKALLYLACFLFLQLEETTKGFEDEKKVDYVVTVHEFSPKEKKLDGMGIYQKESTRSFESEDPTPRTMATTVTPFPSSTFSTTISPLSPTAGEFESAKSPKFVDETENEEKIFWLISSLVEEVSPTFPKDWQSVPLPRFSGSSQLCQQIFSHVPLPLDDLSLFQYVPLVIVVSSPFSRARYLPQKLPSPPPPLSPALSPYKELEPFDESSKKPERLEIQAHDSLKLTMMTSSTTTSSAMSSTTTPGKDTPKDKSTPITPPRVYYGQEFMAYAGSSRYWRNRVQVILFFVINAVLFAYTFWNYFCNRVPVRDVMGYGVCFARAFAACLRFNVALSLLLVCRNACTFLATTWVNDWIAMENHVAWHKNLGRWIGVLALGHIVSHYFDLHRLSQANVDELNEAVGRELFTEIPSYPIILFWTIPGFTGHLMVLVLLIMIITSCVPIRRNGHFNLFWYSHHLYIVFYGALLAHGTANWLEKAQFWIWFIGPAIFFVYQVLERRCRAKIHLKVVSISISPRPINQEVPKEAVLFLKFEKPEGFYYRAGQYLYLNCEAIAKYEWHPFTISSAPQDSYLSVHIRRAGDWTTRIIQHYVNCIEYQKKSPLRPPKASALMRSPDESKLLSPDETKPGETVPPQTWINDQIRRRLQSPVKSSLNFESSTTFATMPVLAVDGPFGAPSQLYSHYQSAVLIGAGIGVTPFASIIRYRFMLHKLEGQQNAGIFEDEEHDLSAAPPRVYRAPIRARNFRIKSRIEFVWIRREEPGKPSSFNWLAELLKRIDRDPFSGGFLRVHTYITGTEAPAGAQQTTINKRHRITYGRPNWDELFKLIANDHPAQEMGVFFCGPRPLAQVLHEQCINQSTRARHQGVNTRFVFHKENF